MSDSPNIASLDLVTLARNYLQEGLRPSDVVTEVINRQRAFPDRAVWIHKLEQGEILAQAESVQERKARGDCLPLYGIPFAVKDSIDVAGYPTTAACPAYRYVPEHSSPVVDQLLTAGAIFVGKTNLDQFGTGLAGDRTPYGACRNVFDPRYISGGSSSGSAVAVAGGLVSFALGTDTAGSGRVPAGCNNIVGLKPTPGAWSTAGLVPSCRSLDCVTALALSADDARAVAEVALGGKWPASPVPVGQLGPRLAIGTPRNEDLEFCGDEDQKRLYFQAIEGLEKTGARRIVVDFRPFREVALLLYEGPWVAERYAAISSFLSKHPEEVHPVTRSIIEGGARYQAVDVFQAMDRLKTLRETCWTTFEHADVLVVPTAPTLPTIAAVQADSLGWSRHLGYYTNFANLLQLAAIALPAGFTPGGLPGGITILGPSGSDWALCKLGMAWQRLLDLPLGATSHRLPKAEEVGSGVGVMEGWVRVAVAGAHLRGQPLHEQLRGMGVRFVRADHTAPRYRFVALMKLNPPRPGLVGDREKAGSIAVELYDLPVAGFGKLVASVGPPLAIGTIELEDSETVKGFLCESWAAAGGRDITEFGGWLAFREHLGNAMAR